MFFRGRAARVRATRSAIPRSRKLPRVGVRLARIVARVWPGWITFIITWIIAMIAGESLSSLFFVFCLLYSVFCGCVKRNGDTDLGCVVILNLRPARPPGCSRCLIRIAPVSEIGLRVKFEWAIGQGAVAVGLPTSFDSGLEMDDRGRSLYTHTYLWIFLFKRSHYLEHASGS